MARKNITGIAFGGIGLEKNEELLLKKWLKSKGSSWARLRKHLVREHLKSEGLIEDTLTKVKKK